MAEEKDDDDGIVIKKICKCPHGAHGGAWKIAFADFMTAAMAFFLMLWVLGGVNDSEMKQIAEYFRNPTVIEGSPDVLLEADKSSTTNSVLDLGGATDVPKSTQGDRADNEESQSSSDVQNDKRGGQGDGGASAALELRQMTALKQEMEKKIEQNQTLNEYKQQLDIDITPNGLQIQILDNRKRPMFEPGVDVPRDYALEIMRQIGRTLGKSTKKVSIQGFTDRSGYGKFAEYSNWELSADRANAARRSMINGGLNSNQVAQVVGLADTILYDEKNPYNPTNRRISITLLNDRALAALKEMSRKGVTADEFTQRK